MVVAGAEFQLGMDQFRNGEARRGSRSHNGTVGVNRLAVVVT